MEIDDVALYFFKEELEGPHVCCVSSEVVGGHVEASTADEYDESREEQPPSCGGSIGRLYVDFLDYADCRGKKRAELAIVHRVVEEVLQYR